MPIFKLLSHHFQFILDYHKFMSVNDSQQNLYSSRTKETGPDEDRSYWGMMIDGIVRPPRANYKNSQLGIKSNILREQDC